MRRVTNLVFLADFVFSTVLSMVFSCLVSLLIIMLMAGGDQGVTTPRADVAERCVGLESEGNQPLSNAHRVARKIALGKGQLRVAAGCLVAIARVLELVNSVFLICHSLETGLDFVSLNAPHLGHDLR